MNSQNIYLTDKQFLALLDWQHTRDIDQVKTPCRMEYNILNTPIDVIDSETKQLYSTSYEKWDFNFFPNKEHIYSGGHDLNKPNRLIKNFVNRILKPKYVRYKNCSVKERPLYYRFNYLSNIRVGRIGGSPIITLSKPTFLPVKGNKADKVYNIAIGMLVLLGSLFCVLLSESGRQFLERKFCNFTLKEFSEVSLSQIKIKGYGIARYNSILSSIFTFDRCNGASAEFLGQLYRDLFKKEEQIVSSTTQNCHDLKTHNATHKALKEKVSYITKTFFGNEMTIEEFKDFLPELIIQANKHAKPQNLYFWLSEKFLPFSDAIKATKNPGIDHQQIWQIWDTLSAPPF